ncbi:MAG: hypothetical protein KA247_03620 [Bacteroidetes bacterium]|nr:hypothetical protein [Bacteroidota bacterium]
MTIGADKDSQKKMIGELLKAADRHIKTAEWNKALDEVGKALAIEPNNMYAMAYKDRINVSLAEEKKKAEEEKVKKLAEDKKTVEKAPEPPKEEPKPEPVKAVETPKAEEKKPEPPKAEVKQSAPVAAPATMKDDSAARVESLRQEFATIQAKLQREVAQLTMQVKEAQALKEAVEKNLNAQLVSLTQELNTVKKSAAVSDTKETEALKKEIESLKEKHKKEIDRTKEIATAEMLTQVAVLQKELEAAKNGSEGASLQKQGETILMTMFHKAWQDGTITNDERALLLLLKGAIEMTEAKFGELEEGTKNEAYLNALRSVWSDGVVTPEESDFLTSLREKLSIPADEHFKLEGQIRKELKK